MEIDWRIVGLTVLIPIAIIYTIVVIRLCCLPSPKPDTEWRDIQLRTGDLVLVRYNSLCGKFVKLVTGHDWTHTGFVYCKNGKKYIIEIANYTRKGESKLNGLCVTPLDKWLKLNDGKVCGYFQYTRPRPASKKIEGIIKKYRGIKLDMSIYNWSTAMFPKRYTPESLKPRYYCSEFIALLLQELGMMEKEFTPASYSPVELTYVSGYAKMKISRLPQDK